MTFARVWDMMRKCVSALVIFLIYSAHVFAACSGTTNGTPATAAYMVANDFQNGRAPGSITPDCIRDLIASGAGLATNVLSLKNYGLPTGGDDTAAINTVLAAALPASFTGTGAITVPSNVGTVTENTLTVTGSPGGTIAIGQTITGTGVGPGVVVIALGTGTGGSGTYFVSGGPASAVGSETLTFQPKATAVVYAPAGIYNHAGLIVDNGVCFYGDGPGHTVLNSTDAVGALSSVELRGNNPCLMLMTIQSNWQGARQGSNFSQAVDNENTSAFTIRYLTIMNSQAGGIYNANVANGRIEDNQVFNTLADAIHITDGSHDIVETNNFVQTSGDDCFPVVSYVTDLGPVYNIRIEANTCKNGFTRGMVAEGGKQIEFVGNIIDSAVDWCAIALTDGTFNVFPVDSVSFVGNTCINTGIPPTEPAMYTDGHTSTSTSYITASPATLHVTTGTAGTIGAGMYVTGAGVPANDQIIAQLTGTAGGVGTYSLSNNTAVSSNPGISMPIVSEVTNILISSNVFTGSTYGCIDLGFASGTYTYGVTVIGNRCVGPSGSTAGNGVQMQGAANVNILGNSFKNYLYEGVTDNGSALNSGYLQVIGNTCDAVAAAGGNYCVDINNATSFTSAVITDNVQINDGFTPTGCVRLSGPTKVTIRDNYCDTSGADSISGITNGEYFNAKTGVDDLYAMPIVAGTKFSVAGCATTSALTGGPTYGSFATSGTTCTAVITLGGYTAPTGWFCLAQNLTHFSTAANALRQTASSQTTATIAGTTVASDVVQFRCDPY